LLAYNNLQYNSAWRKLNQKHEYNSFILKMLQLSQNPYK
jgi:hypothetical protein